MDAIRAQRQRCQRRPQRQRSRADVPATHQVIRAKQRVKPQRLYGIRQPEQPLPAQIFLSFNHDTDFCHGVLSHLSECWFIGLHDFHAVKREDVKRDIVAKDQTHVLRFMSPIE